MTRVLILKTGSVPQTTGWPEDFDGMFLRLADYCDGVEVLDVVEKRPPDKLAGFGAVVVTGSLAMVTDGAEWSEYLGAWLKKTILDGVAVLGICYGHQLMAKALGGVVDYHPAGLELGSHTIELTAAAHNYSVTANIPTRFKANLDHSQTVLVPPKGAEILAASSHDPHQILAYGQRSLSCQFHPEFDLPVMTTWVKARVGQGYLAPAGRPAGLVLGEPLVETPVPVKIYNNFLTQAGPTMAG